MIKVVGEDGYGDVTVRKVSRLAGVSTRTFYEHFEGKEEAFLRTFELVVQRTAARFAASLSGDGSWDERLQSALSDLVEAIISEPHPARLALIESSAAGAAAVEQARSSEAWFEEMYSEGFERSPGGFRLPPMLVKGIVSGMASTIRAHLAAGREQELLGAVPELVRWAHCLHDRDVPEIKLKGRKAASSSAQTPASVTRFGARSNAHEDRPLILTAAAKLAANNSFYQLTVPRIRTAAGVSRRSFEAHFRNVEDCFLEAMELKVSAALESAVSQTEGHDWPRGVCLTFESLCAQLASDPVLSSLALTEVFMAGPSALRRRDEIAASVAARLYASVPPGQGTSQISAEASVNAAWAILRHCLATGDRREILQLSGILSFLVLAPFVGGTEALVALREDAKEPILNIS